MLIEFILQGLYKHIFIGGLYDSDRYGLSKDLLDFLFFLYISMCNVLSLNKCFSESESV